MTTATKRPPRKADLARLAKLLAAWQRDEDRMARERIEFVPGSIRAVRLRDMAALQAVLAYFEQP